MPICIGEAASAAEIDFYDPFFIPLEKKIGLKYNNKAL